MLLKGEQLAAQLARELQPVYLVYGDEPLLLIEAADAIRAAARQRGFDEREVLSAQAGFNWNELYQAGGSLSLFGARKVIDLRLPTGKPGREGSAALHDYCARPSPDVLLLVSAFELDWREEKAAWVAAIAAAGAVVKLVAPAVGELPAWIAGRLARQGQRADAASLRFIADRVEGNLLAAHQEIVKLGALYAAKELSLAEVRAAVLNVARYDLDDLRSALLVGDPVRLVRILDGLQQEGEAPLLILWAISEEVRALAQIGSGLAARRPLEALLKEARVWGARQSLMRQALQRCSAPQAAAALQHAANIDRMIKGLGSGDVWNEFRRLALSLAAGGRAERLNG